LSSLIARKTLIYQGYCCKYIQKNGRVSKKLNQFQILKSLEQDSHFTQRQLSNNLGVSLGKVNYCIKSLIEKGFIKVNNFRNNNKIQYSYLLTPKGIEEKAKLTLDFIRIKTQEYNTLKQETKNMDRGLL
jgi:EPS-associated MarR family transcriptional regulator